MTGFDSFGANAYTRVGVQTGVSSSKPHALIIMLYEGALESLRKGRGCLEANDQAGKVQALSKATRIINEGLQASLDHTAGGQIAGQLDSLYDYLCRRTLQANAENDMAALDEVIGLLDGLREAWVAIEPEVA